MRSNQSDALRNVYRINFYTNASLDYPIRSVDQPYIDPVSSSYRPYIDPASSLQKNDPIYGKRTSCQVPAKFSPTGNGQVPRLVYPPRYGFSIKILIWIELICGMGHVVPIMADMPCSHQLSHLRTLIDISSY